MNGAGAERFELPELVGVYRCGCGRVWPFVPAVWARGPGKRMVRGVLYPVSGGFKPDPPGGDGWHECVCGRLFRFVPALR